MYNKQQQQESHFPRNVQVTFSPPSILWVWVCACMYQLSGSGMAFLSLCTETDPLYNPTMFWIWNKHPDDKHSAPSSPVILLQLTSQLSAF